MKKKVTIAQIRKYLKRGGRMICFGAGGRFNETIDKYKEEHLERFIDCIIDNDRTKWGNVKEIGSYRIPIVSPDQIKKIDLRHHLLLITLNDKDNEVYLQIQKIFGKHIKCIETPIIKMECEGISYVCLYLLDRITRLMPIRNYILFMGWGESQRENESTLRDYLIENGYDKKYKLIWRGERKPQIDVKYTYIARSTLSDCSALREKWKYLYYFHSARYIIYENHIRGDYIRKKQHLIYLNHGTPPIKETKRTIILPDITRYCVCSSEEIAGIVSEQYSVSKEKLLICGSPRFEHLYEKDRYIDSFIGQIYDNHKIILWVPTFRQHNIITTRKDSISVFPYGIPIIRDEKDFIDLNTMLMSQKVILLIKPHPLQDLTYVKVQDFSNIKLLIQREMDDRRIGLNRIMKDTDAIITDYSTVAFDYMLLDRPIGYTIDDMEDYSIGFSVLNPFEYMPGKKIKNIQDMKEFIWEIADGTDMFKIARNKVKDKVHKYQNNGYCKMLVEKLGL